MYTYMYMFDHQDMTAVVADFGLARVFQPRNARTTSSGTTSVEKTKKRCMQCFPQEFNMRGCGLGVVNACIKAFHMSL